MRALLLLAFALAALPVNAEPLNYDYVYLSSNDSETDDGQANRGDVLGGFWSFTKTLHLFGSYDDAGAYAASDMNPNWNYDTRTLRIGVGGHYLLGKKTMIAPAVSVLHGRTRVSAPSWTYDQTYSDTGFGVQLDLRHAFTHWFEITGGLRHARLFDTNSTDRVGGVIFHPTTWLAVGALYHEGDDRRATELTVRWYY